MSKIYKITIQLSEYDTRKLICWAKLRGRPKAAYAAQIIGARLEANKSTIDEAMADIANFEGMSVEELEKRWLDEENFSSTATVSEEK